ncbi:vesicle-associated membrane protein 5 isoform X2 [Varanus komodoensis]|uniref:vesicle-associated membrane protein 5 isoform X2 n=1 Tax=Varanus komodoensis TaxID=61221 RepID=UPI001CF7C32D|nr:vesicle-associated membrane protein 5 isoform X2 [Varanus komodoensis]
MAAISAGQGENRLKQCQEAAEEVTEIMLENYTKVLERDGKLQDLDERADQLRDQSSAFCKTSKAVAEKKRCENVKYKLILGAVVVGIVLLLAIILSLTLPGSGKQEAPAKSSAGGD